MSVQLNQGLPTAEPLLYIRWAACSPPLRAKLQ